MPPPRASSATQSPPQTPAQIAAAIEAFLADHPDAAILEDGKLAFDLRSAKHSLSTGHNRCTLQLWNDDRNIVRRIVNTTPRDGSLRLDTLRFGQTQTKLLELVSSRERRTPTSRDANRTRYLRTLERVLLRHFPDWKPDAFRTAMDLERSFGPAYARGTLVRGNQAWAVIAVNQNESATTIDGILTLGILWLDHCREHSGGKRLFQGLKLIAPSGTAQLTLSRLAWLNHDAAKFELYELDATTEELLERDPADQGNLRTRLIHHPDEASAAERFASAIEQVMQIVPAGEAHNVAQKLRNTAELAFLLHGLEFARARIGLAPNSFAHTLELTFGSGPEETPLTPATRPLIATRVEELFARRKPFLPAVDFGSRGTAPQRRIGSSSRNIAAHSRLNVAASENTRDLSPTQDPLYRAAPERWLESVLRRDLAPLTRSLAPSASRSSNKTAAFANDPDPDTIGNRIDPTPANTSATTHESRVIPRLDPHHVYAQVPAIAGASDRGLLDLLGVTADHRLAVIELKANEDLHFALQGLDYWIRVRHHHLQAPDAATGMGEFHRHGYFRGIELSPLPPRLYLVAPALHIHPAVETVLRYLSPRVEWNLLALDERWRQQVRVVWRKTGGST
ncbi:MAG: hypothetical protein V4555_12215 [Acidobacteriota bacterium]